MGKMPEKDNFNELFDWGTLCNCDKNYKAEKLYKWDCPTHGEIHRYTLDLIATFNMTPEQSRARFVNE